jgi:uncharacterized membrane protein
MDEAPIIHRRRHARKRRSKPAPTTITSAIRSAIHTILTYASLFIIATFILIQAIEAITFILGLHTGLIWRALWVAYLCMVAFTVITFIDVQRDNDAERHARGDVREVGWREMLWG